MVRDTDEPKVLEISPCQVPSDYRRVAPLQRCPHRTRADTYVTTWTTNRTTVSSLTGCLILTILLISENTFSSKRFKPHTAADEGMRTQKSYHQRSSEQMHVKMHNVFRAWWNCQWERSLFALFLGTYRGLGITLPFHGYESMSAREQKLIFPRVCHSALSTDTQKRGR